MNSKKEWFESWFDSPFYRLLYTKRTETEAADFVNKLIDYLHPKKEAKVLDIASGYGRYALQFAAHGFDVTGIDLSETRINSSKNQIESQENVQFFVHDMRKPFYINYFDYAFNFFTSFGYFEKKSDNVLAATAFVDALKDNGILVIDYMNAKKVINNLVAQESVDKSGVQFEITRFVEEHKIVKHIELVDTTGATYSFDEKVSALELEDFRILFENQGMTLMDTFGDYDLQPFDVENSNRLIMIFKKGKA